MNSVLLTVPETAALLRQHRTTVYRKIRSGEIPSVRLGEGASALRVPEGELRKWLAARLSLTDNQV